MSAPPVDTPIVDVCNWNDYKRRAARPRVCNNNRLAIGRADWAINRRRRRRRLVQTNYRRVCARQTGTWGRRRWWKCVYGSRSVLAGKFVFSGGAGRAGTITVIGIDGLYSCAAENVRDDDDDRYCKGRTTGRNGNKRRKKRYDHRARATGLVTTNAGVRVCLVRTNPAFFSARRTIASFPFLNPSFLPPRNRHNIRYRFDVFTRTAWIFVRVGRALFVRCFCFGTRSGKKRKY